MSRAPRLRVGTWNVHGCVGTDGRHDPDRVAEVVRELDLDVLGLQEVDNGYRNVAGLDQLEHLRRATGLTAVAGPTMHGERGHYGNAVLLRAPPTDVRRHVLSVPGREPRGALSLGLAWHGRDVRFVVTHFGTGLRERRHQSELLARGLAGDLTPFLVVVGDFNEWLPRGRILRRLDALLGPSRGVRSFPSGRPLLKLDRIWARPRNRLRELAVHRSPLARRASDHLPVRAALDLAVPVPPDAPRGAAPITAPPSGAGPGAAEGGPPPPIIVRPR